MSIGIEVSSNTKGWLDLKAQLVMLETLGIDIGWFNSRYGPDNDNLQHAQVAAWQETGRRKTTNSGEIPPRPYFRVGMKDFLSSSKGVDSFKLVIQKVLAGEAVMQAYTEVSPIFVQALKRIMDEWQTPPNARLTRELKGFNNPLVETHELIDKATFKVRK